MSLKTTYLQQKYQYIISLQQRRKRFEFSALRGGLVNFEGMSGLVEAVAMFAQEARVRRVLRFDMVPHSSPVSYEWDKLEI